MDRKKKLQLRQIDERLKPLVKLTPYEPPGEGWIRTIRKALGMTTYQFADRLGVAQGTAVEYESREVEGGLSLKKLRKAAEALDCHLVYALVPKAGGLRRHIEKRAEEIAKDQVEDVSTTMALEDQDISSEEKRQRVREIAHQLLDDNLKHLWNE